MEKYTHYGVDVIRQYVDSFRCQLNKNNIQYVDLAIAPNVDVVTYIADGNRRYALIKPMSMPDNYAEVVYITSQTPDDCDWGRLASDIEAQRSGADPANRRTRVKMLLDEAERAAYEKLPEVSNVFALGSLVNENELLIFVKDWLAFNNIDPTDLLKMEHFDVSEDFIKKLIG